MSLAVGAIPLSSLRTDSPESSGTAPEENRSADDGFYSTRRLASKLLHIQHRNMKIPTDWKQVCRRFGVVGVIGTIGISGCERKEVVREKNSQAATPTAEGKNAADRWVSLETLAPGKWAAIEGAAELGWDEMERVLGIGVGTDLNGVRWAGPMPVLPYLLELEARRVSGSDFFCGLTFPVRGGKESVSLIVGGWGGSLVGISSIDGMDASENSTGSQHEFDDGRWYRIRVSVENERIQAWIDDKQVVDAHTEGQKLSLRPGPIEDCAPLGLATWLTSAELRGIRWRRMGE
jgi:hypothetical protein